MFLICTLETKNKAKLDDIMKEMKLSSAKQWLSVSLKFLISAAYIWLHTLELFHDYLANLQTNHFGFKLLK